MCVQLHTRVYKEQFSKIDCFLGCKNVLFDPQKKTSHLACFGLVSTPC